MVDGPGAVEHFKSLRQGAGVSNRLVIAAKG